VGSNQIVALTPEADKLSFHSISFPNEWGDDRTIRTAVSVQISVSIQLVSPTSGELSGDRGRPADESRPEFPFN